MILAFHCIFTTHGTWLPNEPRGSWSNFVAAWDLYRYGPATTVNTRRSIASRPYDRALKREMQRQLKHPPVRLTGGQAQTAAQAMGGAGYPLHAMAIMPDHVHLVTGRIERDIRRAVGHMKADATRVLRDEGCFVEQSIWAEHGWNVYLDSPEAVRRAIAYVEKNPTREGLRPQRWSCVVPYPLASRRQRGASPAAKWEW